jgi:hypothetical protein
MQTADKFQSARKTCTENPGMRRKDIYEKNKSDGSKAAAFNAGLAIKYEALKTK